MSTVVCGTDLSEGSLLVARAAAALAQLLDARLELFHVVAIPPLLPPDLLDEEVVTDLRQAAEGILAKQAALVGRHGLIVTTTARVGTLDEVWHHVRDIGAVALVIGTHARTGVARFVIGSFAEKTLTGMSCPVLIVPPHAVGRLVGEAQMPEPARLVVGVDTSPASDAALAWTGALRQRRPCDVRLVHLFVPAQEHERLGFEPPVPFEVDPELVTVLARELTKHVVAQLGETLPLRIRPNWGGEEDPLAWEAATDDADLLVIGTNQTRRSSARATVRGSQLPVLCVPRRAAAVTRPDAPVVSSLLLVVDFTGPVTPVATACRQLMPDGGNVVLMNVAPTSAAEDPATDTEELETILLGLMPQDQGEAYHARAHVTANRSTGEAVLKAISRFAPDLVAMAAPVRGAKGAWQTIEEVVRSSPKPVVLFPVPPSGGDA
jgi:nucleotide-binding universal stress UspA family protein